VRVLFLDCFSGISGDMTVGALCDLGVKPSAFEWDLSKLDIGDFHMHFGRQQRQNVEGVKFDIHEGATHTHEQDEEAGVRGQESGVRNQESGHQHQHEHEHHDHGHAHTHSHEDTPGHEHAHEHAHEHEHEHTHEHEHEHGHEHTHAHVHTHGRSHAEIRALIEKSDLSAFVKTHALGMFNRIAVAEGKIHGVPPENVTFHEVGALDSLADVICACAGIEQLGVEKVFVSHLFDGRGWIDCAHGRFPIPSAATLEILAGIPVGQIDEPFEFITPTGAAIVAEFGESFGLMPRMKVEKIGYGLGSRKLASRPNVLRAVLGELVADAGAADSGYSTDTITRIETNIDDLSPEITGAVMDKLFAVGALDVFLTPIQMKKNRPAVKLTVLCESASVSKIADLIFAETSSFGVRTDEVRRLKLERKFEKVRTPFGEVTVKLGLKAGEVIQVAPEFESCRAASEKSGQPLRVIYESALAGYAAGRELGR
jgi:pyridinium-3,5-bisthiocarboxylic acid mononucleotide nickel chelatase